MTNLLKKVSTVTVPASKGFKVSNKFKEGVTEGVKIAWVNQFFKEAFWGMDFPSSASAKVKVSELLDSSTDSPIIEALGGQEIVEVSIATVWKMLKKQGQGQEGDLLTNGYTNIFYCRNKEGVLWAVYCRWGSGWNVYAISVADPDTWDAGSQVVSRDSSEPVPSFKPFETLTLGTELVINGRTYVEKTASAPNHELLEIRNELMALSNKVSGYLRTH